MAGLTAGVDLGGTKIQVAVLADHEVVASHRVLTPRTGAQDVVAAMAGAVTTALAEAHLPLADVAAVGVGSPGRIDKVAGAVAGSPNVAGFQERVELAPLLAQALGGVPVTLENDVRVAMLGEHERGAGRPYRNLIGVFVGTGVGGGLILDGRLRNGRGAAGEIGHVTVKPGGRMCTDGRRGHLEAYAGRRSMEARAHRQVERGHHTVLFDLMRKKGRDNLSSGVIAAALDEKDRVAEELVADAVWALAIAIAGAQNLLDLEAVVIGGGLGDRLGQPFADRIAEALQPQLFAPERPPALLSSGLGDLSGAVGAAVLVGG